MSSVLRALAGRAAGSYNGDGQRTNARSPAVNRRSSGRRRDLDPELVAKLQTQGNAENEQLREAMRRAIAVLQAAVGTAP